MATQDSKQIPIIHAPDEAGYRLLELPPELVALLEGPAPPTLYLEDGPNGTAVLRSPDHKYAVRQRNTSNSIILVKPSDPESRGSGGIEVFGTIHESMELVRETEKKGPAAKIGTGSGGKWHEKFGRGR